MEEEEDDDVIIMEEENEIPQLKARSCDARRVSALGAHVCRVSEEGGEAFFKFNIDGKHALAAEPFRQMCGRVVAKGTLLCSGLGIRPGTCLAYACVYSSARAYLRACVRGACVCVLCFA
eukprot:409763-Pleurochrysis_carterae.AAC.1